MAQIRIYTENVELTFTETSSASSRITAVQADVTYDVMTGRVTATQADLTYGPMTGRVTAIQGDLVYSQKTGRVTAVQADAIFIPIVIEKVARAHVAPNVLGAFVAPDIVRGEN